MNKRSYVISGLIILGMIYNMAIGPGGESGGATQSEGGRIVVLADSSPISDRYWSTSSRTFTLNIFGWLTEFSPGKWILGNHWRDLEHMLDDTLQTNGYSFTAGPGILNYAVLERYAAVFIVIDEYPIDVTLLIEYVNGGGGVFLIGGTQHSGSDKYSEFLLHFGMSLQEQVNLSGLLTSFVPHSVTTGVSELKIEDPTPIEVHTRDPEILATLGGWNMLVAFSKVKAPPMENTWRPCAPMPTPRADLAVAVVNERIYAIGGFNGIHNLAIMEEYDPATDTWRSRAPMPTARGWLAATAVNGKIYAIGGWDGTNYLPTVEEYDPTTDLWHRRADMPTHRYGLAVVAVGGRIYAIGGQNEIAYLQTVEEYDPATDTWRPRADMATRRYGLAAGVVSGVFKGLIYALGGFNAVDRALATVEEYNPIYNTWRRVADKPTAQISLAAGAVGGRLYAIGGFETYPSPVEDYDPLRDTWTNRAPLPTMRAGLAAAVVRGRLYAIGGYDGNRRLGTVEEYNPPFYDTDGDGFADDDELRYGRDPLMPEPATETDTDEDGLLDTEEVIKYRTNPWVPDAEADTDGDDLANVAEVDRYGTNPWVPDAEADTDGDDLANVVEVDRYGTNPTVVDTDGDGLGDGEEVLTYKTDPLVADTDGDTYSDGAEVAAGTNPQDPAEHPSTIPGTVTDTATVDTPTAFIPGFCSVELVFALACLVILARRVTKQ